MQDVIMYTTRICGYCSAAKRLLSQYDIDFKELDVSDDPQTRDWLIRATGQRTVPQIFIGGESIGGFRELRALAVEGSLLTKVQGDASLS